ncbi:MAG: PaaI family thioesterase [gamma proteobacterium symbiont of Bathyaustriella thionipta]|nr:PaaI family thioesterase [gamma proteobacterium symbiont of Bathyaustriella thionipta]
MLTGYWIRFAWIRKHLSAKQRLQGYAFFAPMKIRVDRLDDDWRKLHITLPLNRRNRNPGGFMFGGAMAALADPVAALACAHLFPDYAVWTRDLRLDFRAEGRTDLQLRFTMPLAIEQQIRQDLHTKMRSTPEGHLYSFMDKHIEFKMSHLSVANLRNSLLLRAICALI